VTVVFTTTDLYEPMSGASADYLLRGGVLEKTAAFGLTVEGMVK
jgi:hypothetical protein